MNPLENDGPKAKYHQLMELIVNNIRRGIYPDGGMLPSETALAEAAGVSRATVRETLKQLLERKIIVKQQGRRSVINARALGDVVKPMRFAWLSRDPFEQLTPVYLQIYTALQKYMIGANATLIFLQMLDPREEEWVLSIIDSFDGVFLAGVRTATLFEPLAERLKTLPHTLEIDDIGDSPATYTICTDNYLAGRMSGEYLLQQGRRNIAAFIGDYSTWYLGFHERVRGVIDCFTRNKRPLVLQHYQCNTTDDQLKETLRKLLEENPAIDTIWGMTDSDALRIRHFLVELSGRPPEEFYSIGVDGLESKIAGQVRHASMQHPMGDIARLAFQTMINLMSGHQPEQKLRRLPPLLIPWRADRE